MKQYLVTWKINIFAKNPKDAAMQALKIQRDIDSIALIFDIKDENNKTVKIDLWD